MRYDKQNAIKYRTCNFSPEYISGLNMETYIRMCRFVIAFDTKLKQNPDFNEMKGLKENLVSVISFETTNYLSETIERTEAERNTS